MRIQQRTGMHDWIEGFVFVIILSGAMAVVDYFTLYNG